MDEQVRVQFDADDVLALKGALDVLQSELKTGALSVHGVEREWLQAQAEEVAALVEKGAPQRVEWSRRAVWLWLHYADRALRLRGYVVGRPEANERFVRLYRKLKAAERQTDGWLARIRRHLRRF